jgi:hypothetical protein
MDTAAKWLRYVNHTFVVWPHGQARLQQFLQHLNSLRPTIKFTTQVDDNTIPLLDVMVMKRGPKLATKVYQKLTYAGHYLHFNSNHPHHVKRKVVQSFINIANVMSGSDGFRQGN